MAKPLPMRYCPTNGVAFQKLCGLPYTESLDLYREKYPNAVWRFNPWTGKARSDEDVRSDPRGTRLTHGKLRFLQLRHTAEIKCMAKCWTADLRMHFEHWTTSFLEADADPGEVLLIEDTESKSVVGVTGWYPMGDGTAYLRWHGVLPIYRRVGISSTALHMLSDRLRTHYGIHTLYELAETDEARDFFLRRGWVTELDEEVCARVRNSGGDFRYVLKHYTDMKPYVTYCPSNGRQLHYRNMTVDEYRAKVYSGVWLYNPWTGQARDRRDVESDPSGLLLVRRLDEISAREVHREYVNIWTAPATTDAKA